MNLIDPPPEPDAKIIVLAEKRAQAKLELERGRLRGDGEKLCYHRRTVIDSDARKVECADCKAPLDPIIVLGRLADEESRLKERIDAAARASEWLDKRTTFQCAHCRRFTRLQEKGRNLRIGEDGKRVED